MKHLRSLAVVLAVVALALSTGTDAFSASVNERSVQVSVVDDSNAIVGYETNDRTVKDGDTRTILTVTNRFSSQLTIDDVSVSETGSLSVDVENVGMYSPIGLGAQKKVKAEFGCSNEVSEIIVVSVTVSSGSTAVAIDGDTTKRKFEVNCQPPTPTPTSTATSTP